MANIKTVKNQELVNLSTAGISIITDRMKETISNLNFTAKEKYDLKAKIIEESDDMNTEKKLKALDENYDCYNQEILKNILLFSAIGLVMTSIIIRDSTITNNPSKIAA